MSAPTLHSIRIIRPATGHSIATVRVSPPRGEPGLPGADGADGADGEPRTWADLEGKPATFPPASHTHATEDITGLTESMASKADLVGGVIPTAQIPAVAITSYLGSVASQAAMLALSGQTGDWCNRSDTSTAWVLAGSPPNQISSWAQINYPASPVTSVNGQSGVIVLSAANVGAPPATRQVATRWSLEGGGNLAADRTLQLVGDMMNPGPNKRYGTTSGGIRGWLGSPFSETGILYGHTEPGQEEVPAEPAAIQITFHEDSGSGTVYLVMNSVTFSLSIGNDYESTNITNAYSGYPAAPETVAEAFATYINNNFSGHLSASLIGSTTVIVSTLEIGASATLRIYTVGPLGSLGGGPFEVNATGNDLIPAMPPSGGYFQRSLAGTRPLRLIVSSDSGMDGASFALVRISDDAVMARLESVSPGTHDVLPLDEQQLFAWMQGGPCRVQVSPDEYASGRVSFVAHFQE